jgi:hypothetical protein
MTSDENQQQPKKKHGPTENKKNEVKQKGQTKRNQVKKETQTKPSKRNQNNKQK